MECKFKGYHEFLNKEIRKYKGDFDPYIFYISDFFKLLCDVLNEETIKKEDRIKVCSTLGYFILPNDLIPEEIYGPAGYIDDIFLCCYMLKELISKYGIELLEKNWQGEEAVQDVIDYAYDKSRQELEEKDMADKVLEYVGFR